MITAEQIVARYRSGETARQIAASVGVTESTIRAWLTDAGTPRRRPGPRNKPVDDDTIVEMRDSGCSWQEIADQVGMSRTGVRLRWARKQAP